MSKKTNKAFAIVVMAGIAAAIGFTIFGLAGSVSNVTTEISKTKADVMLANADINDETTVAVPILYYDQAQDECVNIYDEGVNSALRARQFEWTKCAYYNKSLEQGIVKPELDENYLPVAVGGTILPNRGVTSESFARWFSTVEGKSKNVPDVLNMIYKEDEASFYYESDNFYPLDDVKVLGDASLGEHNTLFTLNLGVPFKVLRSGDEKFAITADDDTWVFVDNKLVLDMGGIHGAMQGAFRITENGEVETAIGDEEFAYSGVKLDNTDNAVVRIFHADRDSTESVFSIKFDNIVLNMTNASLAKNSEGVMVAYDPSDPSYIAPLGESLTTTPNRSRSMLNATIIQTLILGMLAVILVATISVVWKYSRSDRNQEE